MSRDDVGELAEIRRDLREMRFYVDDDELRSQVSEWIEESHEKGDADTAEEYVERELNKLLAENEMYDAPKLSRGSDGFPDSCSECRHYGAACPVLMDEIEVRWRERQLDAAETEREARRVYQQQAIDVDCRQIPKLLDAWDNQHADFILEGQRLLSRVETSLHQETAEGTAADVSEGSETATPAIPDGGDGDA